jgi:LysR family nitrogen assimilation transcriptional regulator
MDDARWEVPETGRTLLHGVNGKPVELRDLRCFLSVARTGNFGRAARELNVGQPAISHQIQKLESGLGMQLLVRHGRGVTLTRAGTSLRERASQVLALLSSPLEEDPETTDAAPNSIVLALPAEFGSLLAVRLVEQFRSLWPATRLDVQEGRGGTLEEWVQSGRADLAILQDPTSSDEVVALPILSEPLGLVVAAGSALVEETRRIALRDVAARPLVVPSPQHWIRRKLDQAGFQHGLEFQIVLQTDSLSLTKAMIRDGLAATVLPASVVQEELSRGSFVFRQIGRPALSVVHAVAHRRNVRSPAVTDLVRLLREAMVSPVRGGAWSGMSIIRSTEIDADEMVSGIGVAMP